MSLLEVFIILIILIGVFAYVIVTTDNYIDSLEKIIMVQNHRIEKIKTGEKMNEEKFKKLFEKHFLPKGWDIESFDDTKIGYHIMSNWFGDMTAKEFYGIIKKFYNKFNRNRRK